MKIIFKKDHRLSDGEKIITVCKGQEIDLPNAVANRQILKGNAEEPKKEAPIKEVAAIKQSPSTKKSTSKRGRK